MHFVSYTYIVSMSVLSNVDAFTIDSVQNETYKTTDIFSNKIQLLLNQNSTALVSKFYNFNNRSLTVHMDTGK